MDRSFATLARQADRLIEIVHTDEPVYSGQYQSSRLRRQGSPLAPKQKTLGVF
jgi:hypothetical protein